MSSAPVSPIDVTKLIFWNHSLVCANFIQNAWSNVFKEGVGER